MSRLGCANHALRFSPLRCCTHCTHHVLSWHRSDAAYWGALAMLVACAVIYAVLLVKDHL